MANLFVQQTFDVNVSNIESNGAFGSFLGASWVRDTAFKRTGAGSLKVTWPAPSGATASWVNHTALSGFTVGRRYRISAWVYVPTGSPDMQCYVAFQGQGGLVTAKNQWTELVFDWLAGTASPFIGWGTVGPPVAGAVCWIDDISVDLVPTVTGATNGPVRLRGPVRNLVVNPTFEVDLSHVESNPAFGSNVQGVVWERSTTRSHTPDGTYSLKVTWPPPEPGSPLKPAWINQWGLDNLIVGRRYRTTAWVYCEPGGSAVKLENLFNSIGPISTKTGEWELLTHEWVATATGHHIGISTAAAPIAGSVMYTDDWRVWLVDDVTGELSAVLPGPVTVESWFGKFIRRMVYTLSGWQNLTRRKWPGS